MSLGSVLQTALSGMSAAQLSVGVVANNLANSQTPGFKQSRPSFATQVPQTTGGGAAPSSNHGGPNSGRPVEGVAGGSGVATMISGATELSNTDVAQNLVDLSQASTIFRANVQVLATGEGMFEALASLSRRD